jgi:CheY-like chemotaxis protein
MRRDMSAAHDFHVAFLGFSDFERSALSSYFRLAGNRVPHYGQVQSVADADFLVADSDHAASVQLAVATGRIEQTVFIGSKAPSGARAWLHRPIDAMNVMRELDAMVHTATDLSEPMPPAAPSAPSTIPASPRPLPPAAHRRPAADVLDDAPFDDLDATVPGVLSIRPGPEPSDPRPAPPEPVKKKRKVRALAAADAPIPLALLVDDSPLALRFLQTRLLPWGLQVDCAADSQQALALLEQRSYGIAFLDVELGEGSELDGLALCRHIKQSPASMGLTVFMVSAHHSELDRVRGSLAGCDGYLGKPLEEAELARLLIRHGLRDPADLAADPVAPPP